MKLTITAEQAADLAAREGDFDPTTGKPDYLPGFVPSAADRHYERRLAVLSAKLAVYEGILRVVCGHLELPQSESGPADDVVLYDRALKAADEYAKKADADLAVNRKARFSAEADAHRLRKALRPFAVFRTPGHLGKYSDPVGDHFRPEAFEAARAAISASGVSNDGR